MIQILLIHLISITIVNSSVYAECPSAVTLRVGDAVTDCTRVGLNLETNKQVQKDLIEGDYNKKIIEEQKKLINIKDLQIKYSEEQYQLWKTDALRERESVDKLRKDNKQDFWVGILLGAGAVILGGWSLGQVK